MDDFEYVAQGQNPGWRAQLRELGEGLWWMVKVVRDVIVGIVLLPLLLLGSFLYYVLVIAVIGAVALVVVAVLMWAWRTVF